MKTQNKNINNNPKAHYIYKVTCIVNGKSYIGQTTNIKTRFCRAHYGKNAKMKADIDRYGWLGFNIEILAVTHDRKFAEALELHYIDEFDTIRNGYNIRRVAHLAALNIKWKQSTLDKRSVAISRTVWMHDPVTGQTKRANPELAEELHGKGWVKGRVVTTGVSPLNNPVDRIKVPVTERKDYFKNAI